LEVVHQRPEDAVGGGCGFGDVFLGEELIDVVAIEVTLG
jgi:hypothetical protein